MPVLDLHRLPLVPAPDLRRLFGVRTGPPRTDPDRARLDAAQTALGVSTTDPRLLRCALTDPGWCNEAQTPPWVRPWPGNRLLAAAGATVLERRGFPPHRAARRAEELGLWSHLWLAAGQQHLQGAGRARVLTRGLAALVGALVDDQDGDAARAAAILDGLLGP
ncbi:MAG: hypothetical protein VX265_03785 [Myxococcota bacterium]|nr:hypothetical protein [Myxococcota bacterium]